MTKTAVIPDDLRSFYEDWRMSPGLACDGFVFLTGFTGADQQGVLPEDPEAQMRRAFEKVGSVLRAAGLGFDAIVEMTTYHVGLRDHLEVFKRVRAEYVVEPFPAWTAIEVAGFVREGAVIEIRVIARR